ncbi:sulfite exporter TauE/SafE family protein [Nocardioides sp. KC13]|uniref:Probable membrane transporter protein n=1 Tax=Nocardioides turkmenicus TaxID=2711220 RepID=A0A6M1QW32_9ACTN|nr:sulfite exporter TauE/SafE family protein [Nocardioides sp. KC13]NGN91956.1 sulfite exporter TauE/SafE family protein [Nocardioides sp. KC13]
MSAELVWLLLAGIGAGLTGSVAGLASLVSYPSLLAAGLPPVVANVTNTVAMFGVTGGTIAGSRRELRGQGRRIAWLALASFLGGAVGAALLLTTPAEAFETVVPWLVGAGAILLLLRDRIRVWAATLAATRTPRRDPLDDDRRRTVGRGFAWGVAVFVLGIYGGYFGAGVGIIALAVLVLERAEALAITNAVKNVATGVANGTAAIAYVFFAPVDWPAAVALGVGAMLGGFLGPAIVRVAPERPLRWLVGLAGLGLALHLATT